jgi:hypothetical protein
MSDIRWPTATEVALQITEETKLVCSMTMSIMVADESKPSFIAIDEAYKILTRVLLLQQQNVEARLSEEYRRRKGY